MEDKYTSGLYLIATPIGNMGDISLRAVETLRKSDIIACEDTRETGKLTAYHGITTPKIPYHDHNAAELRPKLMSMIAEGKRVALVSDAGTPLISDPGYKLVQECIAQDFYVTCVPGASASLAALSLSGLPADRFMFAGFLPPKSAARRTSLREIANVPATLIFYETAPRLLESLEDMQAVLGDRPACVARELTKRFEESRRGALSRLIAHYAQAGAPKGEIVIVVGAPLENTDTSADIDALLTQAMQTMSLKDAATLVSAQTGMKKKEVYARAIVLKKESGET